MKMDFNQVRKWGAVLKDTALIWLLIFPAISLVAPQIPAAEPVVLMLPAGVTGAEIQQALDILPESGGEVVLPAGNFEVYQPIVLRRDHQTLRGSGVATVLHLADGANCPVIIMGEPVNNPQQTVKYLYVGNLFVDGNRYNQQRELWQLQGEGSEIRNNGIVVQGVSNSAVEHVTCVRSRSGGLVTTLGVRQLTVRDLTAFDNEFDGLACYDTADSLFTELYLHDNLSAGISLDLAFNHNVISNAVLTGNDLGVFMRESHDNQFYNISINNSRHYGVFMAHADEQIVNGWQPIPQSECARNSFTNLVASNCGSAAFWINNTSCTNNVVAGVQIGDNARGELLLSHPDWSVVQ
jgi:hypothetical protein